MKTISRNVELMHKRLSVIPEIFSGIKCNYGFYVQHNHLTSLKNSPKIVSGNFNCDNNLLENLVGGPEEVHGYYCESKTYKTRKLKSLIGAPKIVRGNFYTDTESLEGCPESVGGHFWSSFSEKEVRAVCKVEGDVKLYATS